MLLKQMEYLVSVVDCNSFTDAAEKNYISQSAISQQVLALEKELGVSLLVRENRRFHLTPAGDYFYRHAKELLNSIDAMKRETVRLDNSEGLNLKIGYLSYFSGEELHSAIFEFSQKYPKVAIDVVRGTHEELRELLKIGEVDLILTVQRRAFSELFVNYELLKYNYYIEISIRNELVAHESITVDDLKKTPCILVSSKEQQSVEQDYYENTIGFSGSFLFVDSLDEGRLMVAANRGFMPVEATCAIPTASPAVKRLPLYHSGNIVRRNYCAFWPKERTNYCIEEFAEALSNQICREK